MKPRLRTPLFSFASIARCALAALPVLAAELLSQARATSGWEPERWLDENGASLKSTPGFFWDIEMTRLAKEYSETDLPFKLKQDTLDPQGQKARPSVTSSADIADFTEALQAGRLHPDDKDAAIKAHREMRDYLDGSAAGQTPTSGEMASEFADYHKGASEYAHKNPPGAQAAWKKLLERPAEERHYRSVWAAYMLGKACMFDEATRKEAIGWFERCRQLAREGFADSAGLAADSYGWQARAEYDAGDRPAAARHYLQQLALGDTSAIASLKLLVPDRNLGTGLGSLSFATFPPSEPQDGNEGSWQPQTTALLKAADAKIETLVTAAMKDPVLRQIVTAHILSSSNEDEGGGHYRLYRWLEMAGKAKLDHVEGAASLGWAAYTEADYAGAEKWLKLDQPATPLGLWLQAKLALRKGDFKTAETIVKKVLPGLPDDAGSRYYDGYLPKASAAADLGASLLAQGKFSDSLAAFLNGGCWADAAYVAEHLLTTDELVKFVSANATLNEEERKNPPDGDKNGPARLHWDMKKQIMDLAGRRLIREGRPEKGRTLLDPGAQESFDAFQALIAKGGDDTVPKKDRGEAWFRAAQMLRSEGSSWRGTEDDIQRVEWSNSGFPAADGLVRERLTGRFNPENDSSNEEGKALPKSEPLFVSSTAAERRRLAEIHPGPMLQYAHQAASLACKAAALLPDNAEETADVLNQAGRWIQDLDNPGADKIYYQIEKRCKNTQIGKAVIEKHWFIEPDGPWTKEPEDTHSKDGP